MEELLPDEEQQQSSGGSGTMSKEERQKLFNDFIEQKRAEQGQHSVMEQTPQAQQDTTTPTVLAPPTRAQKIAGRVANVANDATAGAQIGSMFGGLPIFPPGGAAIGGAVGAAAGVGTGLMRDPSDSPMTDIGGLAGEQGARMILNKFFPGAGQAETTGMRMMKGLITAAGYGVGSVAGSIGDIKADFQPETPYGKIGIYTGLTMATMLAHAAFPQKQTRLGELADKYEIPVTASEDIDKFGTFGQFFTRGSSAEREAGAKVNEAGLRAIEKITGAPVRDRAAMEDLYQSSRKNAWETVQQADQTFKADAAYTKQYNQGVKKQFQIQPDTAAKRYGLDSSEQVAFNSLVHNNPEYIIDSMMPVEAVSGKGADRVKVLMKVLAKEDPAGFDSMSQAIAGKLVTRGLQNTPNFGPVIDGQGLAKAIDEFGFQRLVDAFGGPSVGGHLKAQALQEIAQVMEATDPTKKMFNSNVGWGSRIMSYLANKQMFAFASGSAAGGAAIGAAMGNAVAGAAGGLMFAVPLKAVINFAMHSPETAKILIAASKGDPTAATRFVRALGSGIYNSMGSQEEQDKSYSPESDLSGMPTVDLSGLFGRGK